MNDKYRQINMDRLQEHFSIAVYVPVDKKTIQMPKYKVIK